MDRLDLSRIADGLWAGRMPHTSAHVDALAAQGVMLVVNVCEPREYWDGEREAVESALAGAGIEERWLPVRDGGTIPPAVLAEIVAAARGRATYVHCRGGRERSAAVAVAILAATRGMSVDEALDMASAARPAFRPLDWQISGVRSWLRGAQDDRILVE